jgi:hypothetical protein
MRFFLSILAVIILVVVVIVLIASNNPSKSIVKAINVNSYNNSGSSVTVTTTGELVGEDQRQAIRVTIDQSERSIYLLTGYEQSIAGSETFPNTPAAYSAFLGALENQNFALERKTDEQNMFGVCPLGDTYQYELDSSTRTVTNLWSTSCSASDGTFDGYGQTIRTLFSLQIPNYVSFTEHEMTILDPTND